MTTAYQIMAYSPSQNQWQQQIDLYEQVIYDAVYAQRRADSFAHIYNRDRKLNSTDWVGRIQAYTPHK